MHRRGPWRASAIGDKPAAECDNHGVMSATDPEPEAGAERDEAPPVKSFGNIGPHHWSRSRAGTNEEALEYYRQRSHAPGVEEGGGARNFYCMECDGVIPFESAADTNAEPTTDEHLGLPLGGVRGHCPHCGASLEGMARRYFNWVEINEPAKSDLKALLPLLIAGALVLFLVLFLVLRRFL